MVDPGCLDHGDTLRGTRLPLVYFAVSLARPVSVMDIDYDDMIEDYIQEANEPPEDDFDYEESLVEEMMAAHTTTPAPSTPVQTARDSHATERLLLPEQLHDRALFGNDDDDASSVRDRFSESRGTVDVFAFERYD